MMYFWWDWWQNWTDFLPSHQDPISFPLLIVQWSWQRKHIPLRDKHFMLRLAFLGFTLQLWWETCSSTPRPVQPV